MKVTYPVIFTEVDTNILVEIPDLKIYTEANSEDEPKGTMADAIDMARDAIGIYCVTTENDGEELPAPTHISQVNISEGVFVGDGNSFVSVVDVDVTEYRKRHDNRMVKKNCTIPYYLNVLAEEAGVNFSKVLQEALISLLKVSKG